MAFGTLDVTTPSDTEIVMTRIFDAPPGLVFDAYTRPAHPPYDNRYECKLGRLT